MVLAPAGGFGWEPFTEMRRLQSEMNRLFDGSGFGPAAAAPADPPVNLWLGERSVVVAAVLPGLAPEDVEVTIAEGHLTIRGERRPPREGGDVAYRRRERATGAFSRTIALPFAVDAEKAQARSVDGMLEIELPRPERDLPRRIEIAAK